MLSTIHNRLFVWLARRRSGHSARHDIRGASVRLAIVSFVTLGVALTHARDVSACGGCFHAPPPVQQPQQNEVSIVTDHRMVFSISKERTILWDQIRYSGNPAEFVWALPVRPGTIVELSSDRWVSALDAMTEPVVTSPIRYVSVPGTPSTFYGGGGGEPGGCSMGCSSTTTTASDNGGTSGSGSKDGGAMGGDAPPPVDVVSQQVVGPYETVTLRSTNPTALEDWLVAHGYEIPADIRPIVTAYVAAGFDFIALRLRPHVDVTAMQPVRIITPGADLTLPLRMVAAGVGQNVALTLFVVAEGRYHTQNFPDAAIDYNTLVWDFANDRSNYQELSVAAMAMQGGRSFLTEYAKPVSIAPYPYPSDRLDAIGPLYYGNCDGLPPTSDVNTTNMNSPDAAASDAGPAACGANEAGMVADASSTSDAAADDAAVEDAATTCDAGAPQAPNGTLGCGLLDDLAVATEGMDPNSVWVTRLRANLPRSALAKDLVLEAAVQTTVAHQHVAKDPANPTASSIAPTRDNGVGSLALCAGTVAVVTIRLRRRARR